MEETIQCALACRCHYSYEVPMVIERYKEQPPTFETAYECAYAFFDPAVTLEECAVWTRNGGYAKALLGLEPVGEPDENGVVPTRAKGGLWHTRLGILEAEAGEISKYRIGVVFDENSLEDGTETGDFRLRFRFQTYSAVQWPKREDGVEIVTTWVTFNGLGELEVAKTSLTKFPNSDGADGCTHTTEEGVRALRAALRLRQMVQSWRPTAILEAALRMMD